MTCPTRDLPDSALEATLDAQLGQMQPVSFKREQHANGFSEGVAFGTEQCALMLAAYIDAHLSSFAYRSIADGLREVAASMVRMGAKV